MKINSLKKIKSLSGKTVFLRVDFNVPIKNGKIENDYRIKAGLETINFLLAKSARLVIASHLGRPKGYESASSLKPVAARLKTLLKRPIKFLSEAVSPKTTAAVKALKPGEIVMLENLRFNAGEYKNDDKFAASLAALADIYVNDAFADCHRAQASVAAMEKYLPSYAGLLVEKEITALNRILKPKKPLVIIIGGAKIETKAPLISKLYSSASQILIGGALANNFFKFQGLEIGKSMVDDDFAPYIRKFYKGKKLVPKIILPRDVVIKTKDGRAQVVAPAAVKASDTILDIGPASISDFAAYIKKANTLVWNGPLGKFEEASFKHGTLALAYLIAARSSGLAYGVVGGGETVAALNLTKMSEYVDWVSTAGGAMLTYLSGGKMPGLSKIVQA
ncbi:MAG: phosphoglycerate kinase [Candidatus Falkowbacteria bacterium]|nr:phosphoglycerate kinase [Candidatus Falkowbacteria bacterium]